MSTENSPLSNIPETERTRWVFSSFTTFASHSNQNSQINPHHETRSRVLLFFPFPLPMQLRYRPQTYSSRQAGPINESRHFFFHEWIIQVPRVSRSPRVGAVGPNSFPLCFVHHKVKYCSCWAVGSCGHLETSEIECRATLPNFKRQWLTTHSRIQ